MLSMHVTAGSVDACDVRSRSRVRRLVSDSVFTVQSTKGASSRRAPDPS